MKGQPMLMLFTWNWIDSRTTISNGQRNCCSYNNSMESYSGSFFFLLFIN